MGFINYILDTAWASAVAMQIALGILIFLSKNLIINRLKQSLLIESLIKKSDLNIDELVKKSELDKEKENINNQLSKQKEIFLTGNNRILEKYIRESEFFKKEQLEAVKNLHKSISTIDSYSGLTTISSIFTIEAYLDSDKATQEKIRAALEDEQQREVGTVLDELREIKTSVSEYEFLLPEEILSPFVKILEIALLSELKRESILTKPLKIIDLIKNIDKEICKAANISPKNLKENTQLLQDSITQLHKEINTNSRNHFHINGEDSVEDVVNLMKKYDNMITLEDKETSLQP